MKFGKSLTSQQDSHSELHYLDYKLLKKRIKEVVAFQQERDLAQSLAANGAFEAALAEEICLVNDCFSEVQQELLARTAEIAEDISPPAPQSARSSASAPDASPLQARDGYRSGGSTSAIDAVCTRPEAFRSLLSILRDVDQLRKYAVWNAVAVVKILKKRRKQTNFGLEDTAAERAGWLSRQSFFSGSDFAELHVAIESLGHALMLRELGPGLAHAAQQTQRGKKEVQQCPICLDSIADMVELSCCHRFCWKCFVLGPIAHQPGEYRMTQCPICRQDADPASCASMGPVLSEGDGVVVPSADGVLARFLRTYFPEEAESIQQGLVNDVRGGGSEGADEEGVTECEVRDVVHELVKALLTDAGVAARGRGATAGSASSMDVPEEAAAVSAAAAGDDFFDTLPPREKVTQERQMAAAAQKLQWVQLASTGDPLALDGAALCSLCSESLLLEAVVVTPCKHQFHQVCLKRIDMPQCPLCSESLPLSWFLPRDHPCAEGGFRVCKAERYRPEFPGGPSVGTCGYPLHRPPPQLLLGRGGLTMKSYLHRILPTHKGDVEEVPASDDERLGGPASPSSLRSQRGSPGRRGAASSASESSSDESGLLVRGAQSRQRRAHSGSDDGSEDAGAAAPAGRQQRTWLYGALGRMRMVHAPPNFGVLPSQGGPGGCAAAAAASQGSDSGGAEVLLI